MNKMDRLKQEAEKKNNQIKNKINDVKIINIDEISLNPFQPRKTFNEKSLINLSLNIKEVGILNPISLVMKDNKYILVAGERRLKATILLKEKQIKCILLKQENASDDFLREIAIVENLQREDLSLWDEIEAFNTMLNIHKKPHIVAKKLSLGLEYIKKRLKAFELIKKYNLTDKNMLLSEILATDKKVIKENLSLKDLNETEKEATNGTYENLSIEQKAEKEEKKHNNQLNKKNEKEQKKDLNDEVVNQEPLIDADIKETKNNKNIDDDSYNNNGLIEKPKKSEIVADEKILKEEKEIIKFYQDKGLKVTILTTGEVFVQGSKIIFQGIMKDG